MQVGIRAKSRSGEAQAVAKRTMAALRDFIKPGVSERDIADHAESLMKRFGVSGFWYHGIAALVLVGERTPLSVSGKKYVPADLRVAAGDLVTVDLSPQIDGDWGDYARSFVVTAEGTFLDDCPFAGELRDGLRAEWHLHEKLREIARPDTKLDELFQQMNEHIEQLGFVNLDFLGNLGHSIERHLDERRYLERGGQARLGDVSPFTFEPHIRAKSGRWGFKRENIYYFQDGVLLEL